MYQCILYWSCVTLQGVTPQGEGLCFTCPADAAPGVFSYMPVIALSWQYTHVLHRCSHRGQALQQNLCSRPGKAYNLLLSSGLAVLWFMQLAHDPTHAAHYLHDVVNPHHCWTATLLVLVVLSVERAQRQ